jgi:hypothetical protein
MKNDYVGLAREIVTLLIPFSHSYLSNQTASDSSQQFVVVLVDASILPLITARAVVSK